MNRLVGLSGLEPLTSRLSGVRSNQLSYRPIYFREFHINESLKTEQCKATKVST